MCSVWPDVERLLSSLCPLREGWYLVDSRVSTALCSTASPRSYGLWDRNDSARRLTPGRSLIGWQANALLLLVESFTGKGTQERGGTVAIGRSEEGVKRFSQEFSPSKFLQHEGRSIAYLRDRPMRSTTSPHMYNMHISYHI